MIYSSSTSYSTFFCSPSSPSTTDFFSPESFFRILFDFLILFFFQADGVYLKQALQAKQAVIVASSWVIFWWHLNQPESDQSVKNRVQ